MDFGRCEERGPCFVSTASEQIILLFPMEITCYLCVQGTTTRYFSRLQEKVVHRSSPGSLGNAFMDGSWKICSAESCERNSRTSAMCVHVRKGRVVQGPREWKLCLFRQLWRFRDQWSKWSIFSRLLSQGGHLSCGFWIVCQLVVLKGYFYALKNTLSCQRLSSCHTPHTGNQKTLDPTTKWSEATSCVYSVRRSTNICFLGHAHVPLKIRKVDCWGLLWEMRNSVVEHSLPTSEWANFLVFSGSKLIHQTQFEKLQCSQLESWFVKHRNTHLRLDVVAPYRLRTALFLLDSEEHESSLPSTGWWQQQSLSQTRLSSTQQKCGLQRNNMRWCFLPVPFVTLQETHRPHKELSDCPTTCFIPDMHIKLTLFLLYFRR